MTELRASVRQVVEFSLHERDLSPAAFAAKRIWEGAAAHKARQSVGAQEETGYQAEKSLSADYAAREITLRVTGRADGLLLAADGARIVEEIKLGTAENPLVRRIGRRRRCTGTCSAKGGLDRRSSAHFMWMKTARPFVSMKKRTDGARLKAKLRRCARPTARGRSGCWRGGGRRTHRFSASRFPTARIARDSGRSPRTYTSPYGRKRLFAQAPTGIGKTMAALYPPALALGEGKCARVLMLTARTTGRKSAMDALAILRAHGARLLAVEIAAKDKVCPMEKRDCRPEVCPYAKGFTTACRTRWPSADRRGLGAQANRRAGAEARALPV